MDLVCKVCGHLNPDTTLHCEFCGALISEERAEILRQGGAVCPTCQTPYLPGEMICMECGTQLPPIAVLPPELPKKVDPKLANGSPGRSQPLPQHGYKLFFRQANVEIELKFDTPELVIGRADEKSGFAPAVDLSSLGGGDLGVSRKHARFFLENGKLSLEDLGSKNFTFVNRQRLAPNIPIELKIGDEIRFGGLTATLMEN